MLSIEDAKTAIGNAVDAMFRINGAVTVKVGISLHIIGQSSEVNGGDYGMNTTFRAPNTSLDDTTTALIAWESDLINSGLYEDVNMASLNITVQRSPKV